MPSVRGRRLRLALVRLRDEITRAPALRRAHGRAARITGGGDRSLRENTDAGLAYPSRWLRHRLRARRPDSLAHVEGWRRHAVGTLATAASTVALARSIPGNPILRNRSITP